MARSKPGFDSIQTSDRDISLLRGLFESRVMTTAHAVTLYFEGKPEAAKKRLQKLKGAQLISERPRRSFEPAILMLARKGLELLQVQGFLSQYPTFSLPALDRRARVSDLTIRHELEIMDVKAAFHEATKVNPAWKIHLFSTWPILHEFKGYRQGYGMPEVLVQPDGFIRLHHLHPEGGKSERTFFLEVDRSSEVQDKLIGKAECYFDYYKSGGFAVRNGAQREDYKQFPFRVLMVFKTAERRNNTARRLLQSSRLIPNQICLSTYEEVSKEPFGPVWICPLDYERAVKGSPFDFGQSEFRYRRNAERESFVEQRIRKFSILS